MKETLCAIPMMTATLIPQHNSVKYCGQMNIAVKIRPLSRPSINAGRIETFVSSLSGFAETTALI
jgi:hypothetical protein